MDARVNGVPADFVGGVPRPAHDWPNKRPCALLSFPREHIRAKLKVVSALAHFEDPSRTSPEARDVPGRDIAIRRSAPLRRSVSGWQNPTHTRIARAAFASGAHQTPWRRT